ncbi:MAG: hypothetical protein KAR43_06945 [Deltaproteobacteria bacterium]|jgi:hypothetical protein|nr:hypothetical protein [Deltaproteobacteria bacterium]
MDIRFMLVEDERKMEIYHNESLVTDYPLLIPEVRLLKQEGVMDNISRDLVTRICGTHYLRIIENAFKVEGENNNDENDDTFFEFPQES